jgi:hypothetical protein
MSNEQYQNSDSAKTSREEKAHVTAIIPNYLYSEGINPIKDFIEDKEQIHAIISCSFHLSASIKQIGFIYKDCVVATGQDGCDFILQIERDISKKLFYSAKKNHVAETFIVGYINEIIPILNENLIQQKYLTGHMLIRTFSPLDIHKLFVVNKDTQEHFKLSWPISFTNFPRTKEFAKGSNYKFIRDLIEASTFYFYYNLDDCVRKIISSIENFFNLRNIKGNSFKERLSNSLKSEDHKKIWEPYLKIFYSNLVFVYRIRNKIVHEKYRMDFNDSWLCQKGIGTLFYLYQSKLNDENTRTYNYALMKQFVALDFECRGLILDMLKEDRESKRTIMKTAEDTDRVIFGNLEISKEKMNEIESKIESYNN